MYVPDIELHEAATLEQATDLLEAHGPDARLLAGGTDLLVDLKTGRVRVGHVVSINRIESLRGVALTNDGLRIGARTTITELDRDPIVRARFAPLRDATQKMAAEQIRNVATVGGNLASAVSCADLPPILITMHARVTLWSRGGERSIPLEALFAGPRRTTARPGEIVTCVVVPEMPPRFGAAYARFALRDGNAIAVASVAASLRFNAQGRTEDARVVLGAVAPNPKLVADATKALVGRAPDDVAFDGAAIAAMEAAEPISDVRGSADFRRDLVGVLTKRALVRAAERAEEARR